MRWSRYEPELVDEVEPIFDMTRHNARSVASPTAAVLAATRTSSSGRGHRVRSSMWRGETWATKAEGGLWYRESHVTVVRAGAKLASKPLGLEDSEEQCLTLALVADGDELRRDGLEQDVPQYKRDRPTGSCPKDAPASARCRHWRSGCPYPTQHTHSDLQALHRDG